MEWIDSLFFEHSAIQAIVVLSLVTAAGLWLGKMHVWGISLGVTFVFFVGILAGHLGIEPRSNLHRNGHDRTSKLWPVYSLAGHGGRPVRSHHEYTGTRGGPTNLEADGRAIQ